MNPTATALIELDGKLTPRSRDAGEVARFLDRNAALILGAHPRAAEVGIVYNPLAYLTGGNTVGPGQRVRDSLLGFFRVFWERSIPAEFLHVEDVAAGRFLQYKIIFLPCPLMLPRAAAEKLRDFVAAGGTLVSEARPAWNDERGFANLRIPGADLDQVFGAREALLRTVESTELTLAEAAALPGLKTAEKIPGGVFEEHLEPAAGAEILATFPGGQAAVTRARFERGTAVLVGSFVGALVGPGHPVAGRFLAALAEKAGVRPPVENSNPAVEARVMEGQGYRLLFLLNHTENPQAVQTVLQGRARDLLTGREVSGEVTLESRGALVLEVRP